MTIDQPPTEKETVKSGILEQGKSLIVGALAFLLLACVTAIGSSLPAGWLNNLPSKPILLLLALSIVVNLLCAWGIFCLLREERMTLRDGVWWDKENQPHCSSCKTPIIFGDFSARYAQTTYWCIKCGRHGYASGLHRNIKATTGS